MGCPQEGVRCPGTSDLCLNQHLHSLHLLPCSQSHMGLQCCHLNMKTTEDDDKFLFTILLWPLPLDLLCQSTQRLESSQGRDDSTQDYSQYPLMGDKKTHSSGRSLWVWGYNMGVENGVTWGTNVPLCTPVAPPLYMYNSSYGM